MLLKNILHRGAGASYALCHKCIIVTFWKRQISADIFVPKKKHYCCSEVQFVGTATEYGLDDRMIGVRIPVGAGNFSLRHHVETGSGAHPASYPMGTRGFFTGDKAVWA